MIKRGQVSIWIILAVVLLLFVIIGIYVSTSPSLEDEDLLNQKRVFQKQIEACVESVAKEQLVAFGLSGGSNVVISYPYYDEITIRNYYILGENDLPHISFWEFSYTENLLEHIDPFCLEQIDLYGYSYKAKQPEVETRFGDEVWIEVDYPITLQKERNKIELDKFILSIPVRMGHIHDIVNQIVENTREDPEFIDFDFMNSFDVEIYYVPQDEEFSAVAITDALSFIGDDGYIFQFGMLFGNETALENKPPVIETRARAFTLGIGHNFITTIAAFDPDDDPIFFTTYPAIVPIDPITGVINFTPTIADSFDLIVTVSDGKNTTSKTFSVEVRG